MRTSVLVASFALLAIALLAPASANCAGSVEVKASDKSQYKSSSVSGEEKEDSVKMTDGVNSYQKSTSDKTAAASARSGEAENKNYQYADANGNSVSAKSSKKSLSASDFSASSSKSVEESKKGALPCGCK